MWLWIGTVISNMDMYLLYLVPPSYNIQDCCASNWWLLTLTSKVQDMKVHHRKATWKEHLSTYNLLWMDFNVSSYLFACLRIFEQFVFHFVDRLVHPFVTTCLGIFQKRSFSIQLIDSNLALAIVPIKPPWCSPSSTTAVQDWRGWLPEECIGKVWKRPTPESGWSPS